MYDAVVALPIETQAGAAANASAATTAEGAAEAVWNEAHAQYTATRGSNAKVLAVLRTDTDAGLNTSDVAFATAVAASKTQYDSTVDEAKGPLASSKQACETAFNVTKGVLDNDDVTVADLDTFAAKLNLCKTVEAKDPVVVTTAAPATSLLEVSACAQLAAQTRTLRSSVQSVDDATVSVHECTSETVYTSVRSQPTAATRHPPWRSDLSLHTQGGGFPTDLCYPSFPTTRAFPPSSSPVLLRPSLSWGIQ